MRHLGNFNARNADGKLRTIANTPRPLNRATAGWSGNIPPVNDTNRRGATEADPNAALRFGYARKPNTILAVGFDPPFATPRRRLGSQS